MLGSEQAVTEGGWHSGPGELSHVPRHTVLRAGSMEWELVKSCRPSTQVPRQEVRTMGP